jgi:hypothetical protein
MKSSQRCPKCQHDRILYIACVADRYGEASAPRTGPMRIAHYQKSAGDLFGIPLSRSESAGELEAGVCRNCGYTEFYTKNPGDIIVDGTYVYEVAPRDAYR